MKKLAIALLLLGVLIVLPVTFAQDPQNLTPAQQAVIAEMKKICDDYNILEKKMLDVKEQYRLMYGENSDFVVRIETAYKHAQDKMIAAQLIQTVGDLNEDKLYEALRNAKSAQNDLQVVVDLLLNENKNGGPDPLGPAHQAIEHLIKITNENIKDLKDGVEKDKKIDPNKAVEDVLKDNKTILQQIPDLINTDDQKTAQDLKNTLERLNQTKEEIQQRIKDQENSLLKTKNSDNPYEAKVFQGLLDKTRQLKGQIAEMEKKEGKLVDELNKIGQDFQKAPELNALEDLARLREKVKEARNNLEEIRKQTEEAKQSDRPPGSLGLETLKDGLDKTRESLSLLKERQLDALDVTRAAAGIKADPSAVNAAKAQKDKLDGLLEKLLTQRDRQLEISRELERAADKGALLKPVADKQSVLNADVAKTIEALSGMKEAADAMTDAKKAADNMAQAALRIGENKDQEAVSRQADAVDQLDSATQKLSRLSDELERAANPGALDTAADRQRAANKLADQAEQLLRRIPAANLPKNVDLKAAANALKEARDNMNKSSAALEAPEPEIDANNPQTFKDLLSARAANAASSVAAQQKALEQIANAAKTLDGVMDEVSQNMMSPEEKAAADAQQAAAAEVQKLSDELAKFAAKNASAAADPDQMKQAAEDIKQAAADMNSAGKELSRGQADNGADKQAAAAKNLANVQGALAKAQAGLTAKSQQGGAIANAAAKQEQLAAQAKAAAAELGALAQKAGQAGRSDESKALGSAGASAAKAVSHMGKSTFQSQTGQMKNAQEQAAEAKRRLAEARNFLDQQEKELSKIAEKTTPAERQAEQQQLRQATQNTAAKMSGNDNKSKPESGKQEPGKPGQQANNQGQPGQDSQASKSGGKEGQKSQGGGQMAQAGQKAQSAAQDMKKAEEAIPRDAKEAMRQQAEALKKLREALDEINALRQKTQDQFDKTAVAKLLEQQKKLTAKTAKLADELSKQEDGKSGAGQPGGGKDAARKAADKLKKASDILRKAEEDSKSNRPDEAAKKHKEVEQELMAARDELARLAKAQKEENEKRAKTYGKVAQKNEEMAQQLQRIKNELRKNGASKASKSAGEAEKSSSQAAQDIRNKKTRQGLEEEERLLKKLREAEKELREQITRRIKKEEMDKVETMLAVINRMLDGENNISATTKSIENERAANNTREPNRALDKSISKIACSQKDLQETAVLLHEQLINEGSVVFVSEMDIVKNNMEDVWNSLSKDRDTGLLVQDIEQDIINNLTLLKTCLEGSLRAHQKKVKNESKGGGGGGGGGDKPKKIPIVAPLAELILVKSKQLGVNLKTRNLHRQRIAEFTAKNPTQTITDTAELTKALKKALKRIGKEQLSLAQYTEELNGQVKATIIREGYASKKPVALPLDEVAGEMMGVKKRLDQELTNNVTKQKQVQIVKMLNDLIFQAQLQVVPKPPKDDQKKQKPPKSPQGPEQKPLDPQRKIIGDQKQGPPSQDKKQQKGPKKPGPSKPGTKKGGNKPQNPTGSDPKSGGSPLNKDRQPLGAKLIDTTWGRDDEAEDFYTGITEYEDEFPAEYQEEVRAYFNFLQEHAVQEQEKKKSVPLTTR